MPAKNSPVCQYMKSRYRPKPISGESPHRIFSGRIIYLVDKGLIQFLKFPTFWFENTPQGKFMLQIAFGQSKYWAAWVVLLLVRTYELH